MFTVLPRAMSNLVDEISVLFVGHDRPDREDHVYKKILRVRRKRVLDALTWLIKNNPLYADCKIDQRALDALPEDGVPDEIWNHAVLSKDRKRQAADTSTYVHHPEGKAPVVLPSSSSSSNSVSSASAAGPQAASGAAGPTAAVLSPTLNNSAVSVPENKFAESVSSSANSSPVVHTADHANCPRSAAPAISDSKRSNLPPSDGKYSQPFFSSKTGDSQDDIPMLSSGVIDVNGNGVSAQAVHSAGIRRALPRQTSVESDQSLLYFHLDGKPTSELNERRYLELAYPCLYPYGVGGFDFRVRPSRRQAALSVEMYARHCLTLLDTRFRHHLSWIYIVANLILRRTVMLKSSAHAQTRGFIDDAALVSTLSSKFVSFTVVFSILLMLYFCRSKNRLRSFILAVLQRTVTILNCRPSSVTSMLSVGTFMARTCRR